MLRPYLLGLAPISLLVVACAGPPRGPATAISFAADAASVDPRGCAETRAMRAADAQQYALAWRSAVLRVCVYTSDVRASCKLSDGDIACRRTPNGVTREDVRLLLDTTDPAFLARPVAEASPLAAYDEACRAADAEVGLDTRVTHGDAPGLERLLEWGPAP